MSAEDYRQLISACFPDLTVEHCRLLGEGWDSVAIEVGRRLIVRFPKRPDVEPQYLIERQLLPALAGALPLPIPDVALFWPGGDAYPHPFIGHHMIAGQPLSNEHLTPDRADGIARQLGQFLAALHQFPVEQAARLGLPTGDMAAWRRRYEDQYLQIERQILPLLASAAQARVAAEWQAFLSDRSEWRVALIHHDLAKEHILYDAERGAITGIIDWGDVAIGDPAIDFAGLLDAYGEEFVERVLAHYQGQIDTGFQKRMRFYWGAMPLNTVLFGLTTGQDAYVQEGLSIVSSKQ
ncbi:MAG TPA: phosphotransferase [Roseiflexaceae bacterium]|nr:phosphotransferase [Roseiflexaceae bacterium]